MSATTLLAQQAAQKAAEADGLFSLSWLIVALPAFGAAVLLVGGRRTNRWGPWLGVATPVLAFVLAVALWVDMLGRDGHDRAVAQHLFTWIPVGGFHVDAGLLLDPLSMVFVLLVTGVGSLIHVYSLGYMEHDPDKRRFFGYMNLFVAAMLLLVMADDFLVLYVGWEGVGLASYLLIGFWNWNPPYATAANKAFIMNRVGDFGLSIAIMAMFASFGTTSFEGVFGASPEASEGTMTAIGLLLLLAAVGKSAQFPLQAWLLDAMAGPTPVSALIHAATMVTAGVYLVTRSNVIFEAAPDAQLAVVVVGAVTLLLGAIIGTAKDDIKKALAASTMSQIGYMMLAAGLGPIGYAFAIFHLLTHGFFKAGLFLGAGSVMHGMNDEVDMRRFGALRTVMPVTYATFGVGYLAIIGFPGLSGFWSKDKIIEAAFADSMLVGSVALLGAGITAFYMSRVMFMTFFGDRRWQADAHPHESPKVMTIPMVLLAIGSATAGLLLALDDTLVHWLEPVVGYEHAELDVPVWVVTAGTLAAVTAGVALAWRLYLAQRVPETAPVAVSAVTVTARRDLYQDTLNEALVMRPGQWLTRLLVFFDNRGVDGVVRGLAAATGGTAGRLRRIQTGFARSYALSMLGGAAAVLVALLLVRL